MTEDLFRIAVLEGNAYFPISSTLSGISIEESAWHPKNASSSIFVTLFGI